MRSRPFFLLLAACAASASPPKHAAAPSAPADVAHHRVRMIAVAPGVSLEVLDFDGAGEPIVLLAGLGDTAHVFDDFAPRLAEHHHVLAITRRGFGASSGPDDGYDLAARVADDIAVLDALHIPHAIWIGHSIAGDELTGIGAAHADRATALVYIDAAYDHTGQARSALDGAPDYLPPRPPPDVLRDPVKASAYRNSSIGIPFPFGEMLAQFAFDGAGIQPRGRRDAGAKILDAAVRQDFAAVHVPALVLVAAPSRPDELMHGFAKLSAADQQAWHDKWWAIHVKMVDDMRANVADHLAGAKIVEVPHGYHFLFLTSANEVLADIQAFLSAP